MNAFNKLMKLILSIMHTLIVFSFLLLFLLNIDISMAYADRQWLPVLQVIVLLPLWFVQLFLL